MTRDEFISGYMERSKIDSLCRTKDGFKIGSLRRFALPCACGEKICEGWAMVSKDCREDHEKFYGPSR